jgi:hypothetical protein
MARRRPSAAAHRRCRQQRAAGARGGGGGRGRGGAGEHVPHRPAGRPGLPDGGAALQLRQRRARRPRHLPVRAGGSPFGSLARNAVYYGRKYPVDPSGDLAVIPAAQPAVPSTVGSLHSAEQSGKLSG